MTPEQARRELARRELARRQEEAEPEDNENLLQKVVRYGIKDPAIGLLNMGREFANLPHKVSGGYIPELSPSEFNFGESLGVGEPDSADKLIQFAGQYGPSLALPGANIGKLGKVLGKIPKAGKYISKAVSEAIPQGLYSAAQAPQDSFKAGAEAGATQVPFSILAEIMKGTSKTGRAFARAGMGLGGAYFGREGAKSAGFGETGADLAALVGGALGGRGFKTKNEMMKKLTEGVSPDVANRRIKAANKLNLEYLTPAEAGVSPWAAKQQGKLGRTEEGGKLLYEKGKSRQESERRAINKTLDMIYNEEKMAPQIEEAYEKIKPANLPVEFAEKYKDNAIIKAAEKRVKKSPAYQESLKKMIPENVKLTEGQSDVLPTSLVYWDHVKRALYDMGEEASRKGTGGESNIYNQTRRDLVKEMDEYFPEYQEARALYERKKVRDGLEKVFDRKEVNGTNFYQALASENKFDELMGQLRNAPEAAENLKAMRELFKDLMGPPTIKTAKGTEERGMNQARNAGSYLEHLMEHIFTNGINDTAAIEFITSKDWAKQMKEIKKMGKIVAEAIPVLVAEGREKAMSVYNAG